LATLNICLENPKTDYTALNLSAEMYKAENFWGFNDIICVKSYGHFQASGYSGLCYSQSCLSWCMCNIQ